MDALIVAADHFKNGVYGVKIIKTKIILLTNFCTLTKYDHDEIQQVSFHICCLFMILRPPGEANDINSIFPSQSILGLPITSVDNSTTARSQVY